MELEEVVEQALEAPKARVKHAEDHERDNQEEDETTGNRAADIASAEVGEPDSSVNEEDKASAFPAEPAFAPPPADTEEEGCDAEVNEVRLAL